jgi:DNA-binding transcriptional LysR family regulator
LAGSAQIGPIWPRRSFFLTRGAIEDILERSDNPIHMESSGTIDGLNLNLLPMLHRLLQTRSVTQTAHLLGLSQPSVSRALATMRRSFGDPLLIKTSNGMVLTKRAQGLQGFLDQWLAATHSLVRPPEADDPAAFTGTFRIASTDYGVLAVLMPAAQQIMNRAPGLKLEIVPLSAPNYNELTDGSLDLVITGFEPEPGRVCAAHLFIEQYHCLLRPGHPILDDPDVAISGNLSLDQFVQLPHIAMTVNEWAGDSVCEKLAAIGRKRNIAMRMPYFSCAPHFALATDSIIVLPARAAKHFSATCGLFSVGAPIELGHFGYWLVWHERSRRDPITAWLVGMLSEGLDERLVAEGECRDP